jgi:hypothetical protein
MLLSDASAAIKSSEKTLRRYIKKGVIKSRRLGKQVNSPLQVWITPDLIGSLPEDSTISVDGVQEIFDVSPDEISESESLDPDETILDDADETKQIEALPSGTPLHPQLAQLVKEITNQFAAKLDEQKDYIVVLRKELQEKEQQLRLLPDLQKQAEEERKIAQEKVFETEAQKKQIEALSKQLADLKQPWWKKFLAR